MRGQDGGAPPSQKQRSPSREWIPRSRGTDLRNPSCHSRRRITGFRLIIGLLFVTAAARHGVTTVAFNGVVI